MKRMCSVLNGKVINVGLWEATELVDGPDGPMAIPVLPPEGTIEGEFEIEFTATGSVVLKTDYVALRADAYPSIQDQLDMQYNDLIDGGNRWFTAVQAVKQAYPKIDVVI